MIEYDYGDGCATYRVRGYNQGAPKHESRIDSGGALDVAGRLGVEYESCSDSESMTAVAQGDGCGEVWSEFAGAA